MLHTVNKSPFERNSLDSCLRYAKKGSAILLIEDGVYAATKGTTAAASITAAMQDCDVYALQGDLEARGVADKVLDGIKLVDYNGFVDLAVEHDKVQSWL